MSRSHCVIAWALAFMLSCAGSSATQQPTTEKPPDEDIDDTIREYRPFIDRVLKADPNDTPVRKLQKERCRERIRAVNAWSWGSGDERNLARDYAEHLKQTAKVTENLLELVEKPEDQFKCLQMQIAANKKREEAVTTSVAVGANPSQYLNCVKADRIDAEIKLLKFLQENKDPDEELLRKLDPFIIEAIKPTRNDTPLRRLQKDRCRERAIALAKYKELIEIGKWNSIDFDDVLKLPGQLSENLLEMMVKPEDQLKCHEYRVDFLKFFEKFMDARVAVGTDPQRYLNIVRAARLDAEIELLRFKTIMKRPMEIPKK